MDRNLSQARAHSHTHMLTHVIIQTVSHKQFRSQIFEQISDRRTWKDAHPPHVEGQYLALQISKSCPWALPFTHQRAPPFRGWKSAGTFSIPVPLPSQASKQN